MTAREQDVRSCTVDDYLATVSALKSEGFEMCIDVTAVDYLQHQDRVVPAGADGEPVEARRFEVVVNLLSMAQRRRVRIRLQVPDDDPTVPSLFDLYPGTDAMEREAFDMLGIRFEGHPDLTRILMPDDWEGHPLRKDYDQSRIPVQFKAVHGARHGS